MKKYFDINGRELKSGDIIDIKQTVNGENIFIVIDADELDIRYGFDITLKYEYPKEELLSPGEVEWQIVGSIDWYIRHYPRAKFSAEN